MSLLSLPNELISRIITYLDSPSPFDTTLLHKPIGWRNLKQPWQVDDPDEAPDGTLLWQDPLKQLSLTCRLVRSLAMPTRFKYAVLRPSHLTEFLAFLTSQDLNQHVSSLVADVPGMCRSLHPAWWARLLNEVPATRFSLFGPPEVLAQITGIEALTADAWAFDMACQILQFEQYPDDARVKINYDDLPNILVARRWRHLTFNEGSSLLAYTTYEFFLRRTPSLLTALHFANSAEADMLFDNLLSFEYIAIFPFYNHVAEILMCIRKMLKLKRLMIKLCPEPGTTVLQDEIEQAGGHLDINDPWNECETSWMLIAHSVVFLTEQGSLAELQMDDVKVEAVRHTLETGLNARLQEWWTYQGEGSGLWQRKSRSPHALVEPPEP
ncbi:hypothetical protein ABEF92_007023 [Exophiala dermatitidis]|uniref:F-box domain-containing protein n=1 Tax=Exophiala dermatitidis (strain ATCC 34100 / CBS 525.76 / NIH/UT8656) TaxID=858893 RepID=H6C9L9_EXODN|nr:uncharacterized protein HMPREF1120_08681 [Exophiala dermatitidis NIH/UT8656]EHY60735.1 hypothetical protein HMPREF1120_08681 [Exophiala dermatitidis NIH/UT8656]